MISSTWKLIVNLSRRALFTPENISCVVFYLYKAAQMQGESRYG